MYSSKNFLSYLLALVVVLNFSLLSQTSRWYLSPTGSGNQDGKSRANARLFTNVNTLNIRPGDTVLLVEGIYNGQLLFQKSGTPNNLIVIMPDPQNTGEAILRNTTAHAVDIRGTSYIKLYKLKITNSFGGVTIGTGKVKFIDSVYVSKNAGPGSGIGVNGNSGGSYNPDYDPAIHSGVDSVFIRWCYVATDTQVTNQTDCIAVYWAHGVRIIGNYLLQGNYTGDGHNDCIQAQHAVGDLYIANNMLINLKVGNSQIFMNDNSWKGYKTVIYNNVSIHYGDGVGMWQSMSFNGWNPNGALGPGDGECYLINNTLVGKRVPFVYTTLQDSAHLPQRTDSLYAVNNIIYQIQSDGTYGFGVPKTRTDTIYAMYVDNNIHAINGGTSTTHIGANYGNVPKGNWTLDNWRATSTLKMLNSTTQLPTFRNFQYNSALYNQEDLRLTSSSVGVGDGRTDIKIKGNQWVNLKTLIESFGLQWKGFDNPYVSWSNPVPRSETNPTIGAWEYTDGPTGNLPPAEPSNPFPQNGASGQPNSLTLSWTCSDPNGDPLTYDVYFGTNNNPPLVSQNQQNNNYNVSNLTAGTTYYWRVVARDNQGASRSGNVWSFTTALTDTIPPRLISASLIDNVTLSLTFSENISSNNATNLTNFSINNGIQISNAVLNGANISLTTSQHAPGFYQITVNNLTDLAGNLISSSHNSLTYGYNPDTLINTVKFSPFNANASSIPDPNLNPFKTFDGYGYNSGDPSTRWAAAGLPQWIGYDLGDVRILNKIRVQFYRFQDRTYQYSIEGSVDSVNWTALRTDISSVMGAEWDEQIIEPTPARYVRVIVTNNSAQNNWASIWESEFYGQLMVSNDDGINEVPNDFVLEQNYPNPFNPVTRITYSIPGNVETRRDVSLRVYDILGNEVATLVNEYKEPGKYEVEFDASGLTSGVYVYRLQTDGYISTKKMILLR